MFRVGASDFILLCYRLVLASTFIFLESENLTGLQFSFPAMTIFFLIELGCGLLIAVGAFRSSLPFLLSLYCVVSALLGHNYWDFSAVDQHTMCIFFFKNVIMAWCFFILTVTGPGAVSMHAIRESKKTVQLW